MKDKFFTNQELGQGIHLAEQFETFASQFEATHGSDIESALQAVRYYVGMTYPSTVIVESTPVYATPHLPSQSLNHPSAMAALHMSQLVRDTLQEWPTQHWVMVDEWNYGAKDLSQAEIMAQFEALRAGIPAYADIDRIAHESDFNEHPDDTCSNMDSRFQLTKLREATQNFECMDQVPLLVNIHPTDFLGQQRQMIEKLIKAVRSEPALATMSKAGKRDLVLNSFLHVWTGEQGQLQVTRPMLQDGEVRHIPLTYEDEDSLYPGEYYRI